MGGGKPVLWLEIETEDCGDACLAAVFDEASGGIVLTRLLV